MLRLKALDHVGLPVSDMDRSLRFYCDGLGLELLRRSERSAALKIGGQEINMFVEARVADPAYRMVRAISTISAWKCRPARSTT